MKKLILILLLILGNQSLAFDIVYPKQNDVTINADSTFFIGSSNKPLKINNIDVPLHNSGGFAFYVNLINGKNTFIIQNEDKKEIFIITKPIVKAKQIQNSNTTEYKEVKTFEITNDNTPLRSTPISSGINRISHLQRNILVNVNGEKNGFYRVILDNNTYGWVSKTDVKLSNTVLELINIPKFEKYEDKDFLTYIFHLEKKVPYKITENNSIKLEIFNIKDCPNNTYTIEIPVSDIGKAIFGYEGKYTENDFVLKVRKYPDINSKKPLKNIKISLDAGHGGTEKGAIGCLGHTEKDINLSLVKNLETELKKRGAKVFLTRDDDIYVGLKDRVEKSNNENSHIFISIHGNALPDGYDPNQHSGTSIYYYYDQARPLAENILKTMVTDLKLCDDKVRQGSLAVVRNTNAPSILIEVAYLINPEDNSKLITPEFQQECAKAIADGIEKYFLRI